ncbi:unnamed protein product [Gongylonema pulchrum]|uniref:HTH_Tnp_Tc3_1 domain-containing protein n=1 Tax=Gongylonema pulchrum TaxID=637853 RepID=A0A183DPZ4_9BILA|nr:unnamed protein product [Gongylonema pulchrum]
MSKVAGKGVALNSISKYRNLTYMNRQGIRMRKVVKKDGPRQLWVSRQSTPRSACPNLLFLSTGVEQRSEIATCDCFVSNELVGLEV